MFSNYVFSWEFLCVNPCVSSRLSVLLFLLILCSCYISFQLFFTYFSLKLFCFFCIHLFICTCVLYTDLLVAFSFVNLKGPVCFLLLVSAPVTFWVILLSPITYDLFISVLWQTCLQLSNFGYFHSIGFLCNLLSLAILLVVTSLSICLVLFSIQGCMFLLRFLWWMPV